MRTPVIIVTSAALVLGCVLRARADGALYTVVESKSSVRVHVGKSGAFSFAGHRHEVTAPVSGTVTADAEDLGASKVDVVFAAGRLHVLPDGEPSGDAPRVEEIMHGPEVLDAARFPEIGFRSTKVTGEKRADGGYDLRLVGELRLHGVTREVTVPVKVTLEGPSLTATGEATLRQDQFGMKAVSAAGGTVKVANELRVEFEIVAQQR